MIKVGSLNGRILTQSAYFCLDAEKEEAKGNLGDDQAGVRMPEGHSQQKSEKERTPEGPIHMENGWFH